MLSDITELPASDRLVLYFICIIKTNIFCMAIFYIAHLDLLYIPVRQQTIFTIKDGNMPFKETLIRFFYLTVIKLLCIK